MPDPGGGRADQDPIRNSSGTTIVFVRSFREGGKAGKGAADWTIRSAMRCSALEETERRRVLQQQYNEQNGITPTSILKPVTRNFLEMAQLDYHETPTIAEDIEQYSSAEEIYQEIERMETQMKEAAQKFEFEKAADLRDKIKHLREIDLQLGLSIHTPPKSERSNPKA